MNEQPSDTPSLPVLELASRLERFIAVMIDSVIGLAYGTLLLDYMGVLDAYMAGEEPDLSLQQVIMIALISFVIFIMVHGYTLLTNGQTLGKKLVGIRIADMNGEVPDINRLLCFRYLPILLANLIFSNPPFIQLLDAAFIFRSDRRCLHDMLADTCVVKETVES